MRILIVDDDRDFIDHLKFILADSFVIESAISPQTANEILATGEIEAILLDIDLKADISGLDMLKKIRSDGNDIPVIMISGTTSVETVVHAMKHGADDYIGKTIKVEELKASIYRALSNAKQKRELLYLRSELDNIKGKLWGESESIQKIRDTISLLSGTDSPVLINGESGTGKELVAKSIHQFWACLTVSISNYHNRFFRLGYCPCVKQEFRKNRDWLFGKCHTESSN